MQIAYRLNSRYESATSGPPTSVSSPTSQQYETASQGSSSHGGRTYSAMSFDSHTLQPDSPANLDALLEDEEDERTSKAASRSGSFISAVSDQDFPEDDDDEADLGMVGMEMDDLGLVNLHMQVNKPITDSPLLMSSYISHLTQLRCAHWTDPVAAFHHEQQQQQQGGYSVMS